MVFLSENHIDMMILDATGVLWDKMGSCGIRGKYGLTGIDQLVHRKVQSYSCVPPLKMRTMAVGSLYTEFGHQPFGLSDADLAAMSLE